MSAAIISRDDIDNTSIWHTSDADAAREFALKLIEDRKHFDATSFSKNTGYRFEVYEDYRSR